MVHKGLLGLVMLFLVCSHVLSSVAVPATRSLLSNEENPSSAQDFLVQVLSLTLSLCLCVCTR
uniref:Uncharacterized protein n=1 Tax=Rhizophora mucronata TaxID=61149 RepID=A0A2P2KYJ3_RHIMU